jgi:glycosyltransferase involved in cell wall biosynthesis
MRIAYIINHLGATGVNNVVRDLVSVFGGHGHECTVFWLKDCEQPMRFEAETQKLVGKEQLADYDLIHAHGLGPMLWLVRNGRVVNGAGKRIPTVTTLHCHCFQDLPDLYGRKKGTLMGVLFILLARRFDKVVCLSKSMMDYYRRWIPRRRLSFVYNTRVLPNPLPPVGQDMRDDILAFKEKSILVGMNGVLIHRKGVDIMLEALEKLIDEGHDFRLVIAGDGPDGYKFVDMMWDKCLGDRVFFLGNVEDAWRLLPLYDIFALPSRSEGFSLALLEACSVGVKSVVSDLPIFKECFVDHQDVEMFRLADGAEGLKEALLRAAQSHATKEQIMNTFNSKFSPDIFYRGYLNVYNEILNK